MVALALLLSLVGNSGGIVGLITARVGGSRAAFRLGLATLKILPQRGAQTPPLPHPVCALGTIVHGTRLGTGGARRKALWRTDRPLDGARLRHFRPYGKDRRARGRVPFLLFSPPAGRCRSSVVEHPLGKGEVVSSILTGSTRKSPIDKGLSHTREKRAWQNRAEQSTTRHAKTHQISTKRSVDVHAASGDTSRRIKTARSHGARSQSVMNCLTVWQRWATLIMIGAGSSLGDQS